MIKQNVYLSIILLILFFSLGSCTKDNKALNSTSVDEIAFAKSKYPALSNTKNLIDKFKNNNSYKNDVNLTELELARAKFRFRWDGCNRPLGVCIILGIYDEATPLEDGEGWGDMIISGNLMKIIPNQSIELEDGSGVPISNDIIVPLELLVWTGYSQVLINSGLYAVDSSDGSVVVEIVTQN